MLIIYTLQFSCHRAVIMCREIRLTETGSELRLLNLALKTEQLCDSIHWTDDYKVIVQSSVANT